MPALITPFTTSGEIDIDAHRHNLSLMSDRGATGVLIGGSTGEGPYLESGERHSLVAAVREVVPSMVAICGVNAESIRQASAQIAEAEAAGAHAVLVITPTTLVRSRPDLVEAYFLTVADLAGIPVFLYSVPAVTGVELPIDAIGRLAHHARIVGMKDSGGDPSRLATLAATLAAGFIAYAGASRALASSALAGAWGAITASANYAIADVALAAGGDPTAQQRLTTLTATIEKHGVPGTKAAAGMTGLRAGASRRPLVQPGGTALAEIADALSAAGLMTRP